MVELLNTDDRKRALAELDGWTMADGRSAICRTFQFKTFKQAFAFMTQCAMRAEQLDHHPEWSNSYNRVDVVLATHTVNGVTRLDIQLARFMNKVAGS